MLRKTLAVAWFAWCAFHVPCRADDVATQTAAPPIAENPPSKAGPEEVVLRNFLDALAKGEVDEAYALVAPGTKLEGDPIAYGAKVDRETFSNEFEAQSAGKFGDYKVGKQREEGNRVRIFIHFKGGDNDETLLVQEEGRWYVADPIHIIR